MFAQIVEARRSTSVEIMMGNSDRAAFNRIKYLPVSLSTEKC